MGVILRVLVPHHLFQEAFPVASNGSSRLPLCLIALGDNVGRMCTGVPVIFSSLHSHREEEGFGFTYLPFRLSCLVLVPPSPCITFCQNIFGIVLYLHTEGHIKDKI